MVYTERRFRRFYFLCFLLFSVLLRVSFSCHVNFGVINQSFAFESIYRTVNSTRPFGRFWSLFFMALSLIVFKLFYALFAFLGMHKIAIPSWIFFRILNILVLFSWDDRTVSDNDLAGGPYHLLSLYSYVSWASLLFSLRYFRRFTAVLNVDRGKTSPELSRWISWDFDTCGVFTEFHSPWPPQLGLFWVCCTVDNSIRSLLFVIGTPIPALCCRISTYFRKCPNRWRGLIHSRSPSLLRSVFSLLVPRISSEVVWNFSCFSDVSGAAL